MDFHTLVRKDLQSLCKKNKIPANMTNVAMADALQALQHVEGIEELMNQSDSNQAESPERLAIGTPAVPRTNCRTSTRRKVSKEADGSRSVTQTRRVNVIETPAVASSRRRAPATSGRLKLETQMKDDEEEEKKLGQGKSDVQPKTPAALVQRVYSIRRSVRLLERNMEELSLKEKTATEPVKIDDFSMEVVNNNPFEEEEKKEIHVKCLTNCARDPLFNYDSPLKECSEQSKESNLEDDVEENNKGDTNVAQSLDAVSVFDEIREEGCDEQNALMSKLAAKSIDNDEETDKKGSDDVAALTSGVENLNVVSDVENDTSFGAEVSDEVSAIYGEVESPDYECQNVASKDCDMNVAEAVKFQSASEEEFDDGKESDQLDAKSTAATDSSSEKFNTEALVDIEVIESEELSMTIRERHQTPSHTEEPMPKIQECIDSENLVDVAVTPEVEFALPTIGFSPSLGKIPTPVKKTTSLQCLSASRNLNKKVTFENSALVSEVDKENIDNSCMKVEQKKDEAKKNKKIILEDQSLRKLKEMYKKKQIANNKGNTEDTKNVTEEQMGKLRQALATLPENRLAAGETQMEI